MSKTDKKNNTTDIKFVFEDGRYVGKVKSSFFGLVYEGSLIFINDISLLAPDNIKNTLKKHFITVGKITFCPITKQHLSPYKRRKSLNDDKPSNKKRVRKASK